MQAGRLIPILLLLLLSGCASYTVYDATGSNIVMQGRIHGRGCIAVDRSKEGTSAIVQQAGRTNWGLYELFGGIAEIAGSVFGGSGSVNMSDLGDAGCGGLFVSEEPEAPAATPVVLRVEAAPDPAE